MNDCIYPRKIIKQIGSAVGLPILLAFLFNNCTLLLKPADAEDTLQVDDGMFDCFCARPSHDQNNYICLSRPPDDDTENLAQGSGAGLLPGLAPSDTWNFDGNNPDEGTGTVRTLYLIVYGDTFNGDEFVAEYDETSEILILRTSDASSEFRNSLQLCME